MADSDQHSQKKPRLLIRHEDADQYLWEQISVGSKLLESPIETAEDLQQLIEQYMSWHDCNKQLLEKMFGGADLVNEYISANSSSVAFDVSLKRQVRCFRKDVTSSVNRLKEIRSQLVRCVAPKEPPRTDCEQSATDGKSLPSRFFFLHETGASLPASISECLGAAFGNAVVLEIGSGKADQVFVKIDGHPKVSKAVIVWPSVRRGDAEQAETVGEHAPLHVAAGYLVSRLGWGNVAVLMSSGDEGATIAGRIRCIRGSDPEAVASIAGFLSVPAPEARTTATRT